MILEFLFDICLLDIFSYQFETVINVGGIISHYVNKRIDAHFIWQPITFRSCFKQFITLYPVVPIVCFGIKLGGGGILKLGAAIFTLSLCGLSGCIEPVQELVSTAAVGGDVTDVLGVLDSSILSSFGPWVLGFIHAMWNKVAKQISFPLLLVPAVGSRFWHHVRLSEAKRTGEAKYIFKVIQFNG